MYERFLKYHNLPSGAVLGHLLKRAHLTQRELSERTGILPQRINDFIVGRRRISADVSLKIESALSIDIEGFFYIIQCHHDVYNAMNDRIKEVADTPDLSKIRKAIFWDTALESIDWRGNRRAVVQRVFEYGDEESVGEIIRFYGKAVVEECLAGIKDVRLKERRDKNAKMYMSWSSTMKPYSLTREEVVSALKNVWNIMDYTEVISLRDNYWEFVADDLCEAADKL